MTSPKAAVDAAVKKGIHVLAITDHDSIDGALRAQKYAKEKKLPVEIIIGEEIYCNGGHIIGLFLKEKIDSFMSLEDTLAELKKQDAIVIIPHMLFDEDVLGEYAYRYRVSYLDLVNNPEHLEMIHGLEVDNFSMIESDFHEKSEFINEIYLHTARISSSDAHILMNFGFNYTLFPGKTAQDLRNAILKRVTIPICTKKSLFLNQIIGWGPFLKLPIHLSLLFTYRVLRNIFHTTKKFFQNPLREEKQ